MMDKYKRGFTVLPSWAHPIVEEEWLFSEDNSNKNKLQFLGYDANLFAMPDWDELDVSNVWDRLRVKVAQQFTKDFEGEVWLDKVRIDNIVLPKLEPKQCDLQEPLYVLVLPSDKGMALHKKTYRKLEDAKRALHKKDCRWQLVELKSGLDYTAIVRSE